MENALPLIQFCSSGSVDSSLITHHRFFMNDIPDAAALLAIARTTLLDKLLAHVPQELRYDALMIANAMAIAAREQTTGDRAARDECARLSTLLGEKATTGVPDATLAGYRKRLASEIRSGRFDNDRTALLAHLEATAAAALAISNPKALEGP
jgi:hypothetical protein